MFRYFEDNMLWSQSVLHVLNAGGDINEVHSACGPLKALGSPNRHDWARSWSRVAQHLSKAADLDAAAGRQESARDKSKRAALYFLAAERMLEVEDAEKGIAYENMRCAMRRYLDVCDGAVSAVEVPYLDGWLPGYFVAGQGDGPRPTVIVVDGFDITRELMLFRMANQARERGLSLLVMDTPGIGEALRGRGLIAQRESEMAVSACADFLRSCRGVDVNRLGLIGVSLGGYYAGRAAAFEHRIRATVLWGAIWNAGASFRKLYGGPATQRPAPPGQLLWVTGTADVESGLAILDSFTLEGIADRIEGPLLILHGAHDHIIAPDEARKVAQMATAADVTLHIRDTDVGGVQHCQVDSMPDALNEIFDWLNGQLKPDCAEFPANE